MVVICLTGKKGVGKSTLINEIKQLNDENIKAFMADEFILNSYQKNEIGYTLINQQFGNIFNNEEGIDKKKLGDYIFNSKIAYNQLTKITNSLIKEWIEKTIIQNINSDILIIELAIFLKFKKFYKPLFDKIILIKAIDNYQENHVSDFLDNLEIDADLEIFKFDKQSLKKIVSWIKVIGKVD